MLVAATQKPIPTGNPLFSLFILSSLPDVRDVTQLGGVASVPMLATDIYKSTIEFCYRQDGTTKETTPTYTTAHPRTSRSLLSFT